MKTLKTKTILFSLTTLLILAVIVTSCEQESVINPNDIIGQTDQNRYVFEGLKLLNDDALTDRKRQDATYFERDEKAFKDIVMKQPKFVTFNIPQPSGTIELELEKWNIFSDDFTWEDGNDQMLSFENLAVFYKGKVKNDPNSIVAVSIVEDDLSVSIMNSDETQVVKQEDNLMTFYKVSGDDFDLGQHGQPMACTHTNSDSDGAGVNLSSENIINHRANNDPIRVRYLLDTTYMEYFNHSIAAPFYIFFRFNEVKAMYSHQNIPLVFTDLVLVTLEPDGSGGALNQLNNNFSNRFAYGSNNWDVTGALVAIDFNGGTTGCMYGGGIGSKAKHNNKAPICQRGAGLSLDANNMPLHLVGINERPCGVRDDIYFTYCLAHELGHNFGINQEYNNITGDIMDHYYGNYPGYVPGTMPLHIAPQTGSAMYSTWADCY